MGTTAEDIKGWFDDGVKQKADYMLVVCDTFDWEDYPVYCSTAEYWKERKAHSANMQRIMESYDLHQSKDSQTGPGTRVDFYPPKPKKEIK